MPTVMSKTEYAFALARVERLKETQEKRAKKIAALEKQLTGVKPVDMRAKDRRKSRKTAKAKRRSR